MKAFVTGAGGFIASHLVESLLNQGWQVKALVRYNSRSSWGWLEEIGRDKTDNLEVILGDVADPYQMQDAMKGCETVFHLAALIGIPYSYEAPASYISTNVNGTLNLLKAAMKNMVGRFIHTSTSEVYGTAQYVPIDEKHPLQGQSPYSASKIAADKLAESFYFSFGLPVVTVRPFNTYGPRQSARAVIPTIISQALKSREIHLGSLDPVRDMTFVDDTVSGFIAAALANDHAVGKVINLGTGTGVSIGELANGIFEILGNDFTIITEDKRIRPEKSEVMRLISNNKLAREIMGWEPKVSLHQGLRQTIEWIKKHQQIYKTGVYIR